MSAMIDRVQAQVKAAWTGVDVPKIVVAGIEAKLIHPKGQSVSFDLSNRDLALSDADFAATVLNPAIAALKAKLNT